MTRTPETKTTRVLIVDDHEMVRVGLRTLLDRAPGITVAGEASSTATAVSEAVRLKPDLILLDVRLGEGNGFDACRRIRREKLDARVLILTAFGDDQTVFNAIACGADGYLLKEISSETLIQGIRTVAAGQSILDPIVTRRVMTRVRDVAEQAEKNKFSSLSAQERRVVALVSEGKTNKEIGLAMGLSDRTVKNYLSNAMEKLQLTRRSQAAAFFALNSDK